MAPIQNFAVAAYLDPGIEASCRQSEARPTLYPPTQAGLALAQDHRDYLAILNRGAYGPIGAGSTHVYAQIDDGLVPLADIPSGVLRELPTGQLSLTDWQCWSGDVWDGHNHRHIVAYRSRALWARLQFQVRP